jgi:acyl-CoA reductase-like NAD-dependent aldehyde dehydrogenase
MPFGGQQQSGLGTGGIIQTIKEYSKQKLIVMKF